MFIDLKKLVTIIKKELLLYFTTLSNYLVIAGVLLVGAFLFFNNFYNVGVSSFDEFFSLLPWIFTLLVPALAMGVIARERQDKTLRYLLAQPVNEWELVLGKFIGGVIFLSFFLLVSMIIPISLQGVASFDWGVIAAGYIGSLLLLSVIFAVNLFVSSLFENQLAVFVVSFIVNLVLMLVGTTQVGNIIPPFLLQYVAGASPLDHYFLITRGLISFGDVLHYILAIVAFLLLSVWQIQLLRGGRFNVKRLVAGLSVQMVALLVLAAAYFSFLVPGRIDITQQQIFTLASGTENIVKNLSDTVTLTMYTTADLPPQFKPRLDDIKRLFDELKALNGDKINVVWKYPATNDTDLQEAYQLGIYPQSFTVVSQTEYQAKEGYMGLNIAYNDDNRTISFIGDTSDLEFQVMSRINDLTLVNRPTIAYINDPASDTALTETAGNFFTLLDQSYTVKVLDIKTEGNDSGLSADDLNGVDVILVGELTSTLSDTDRDLIQKSVDNGVSLIVLSDGIDIDLSTLQLNIPDSVPVNDLLSKWGITINKDVIYDSQNANLLTFSTQQGRLLLPYPFWPTVEVISDNVLLKDFKTLTLPWSSSISMEDMSGHEMIATSGYGGSLTSTASLSPDKDLPTPDGQGRVAGVYIPATDDIGAIIVVGTANLIDDSYSSGDSNNVIFTNLLFDIATQNTDIASIKAKNRIATQLVFTSDKQKNLIRYGNLLGGPLVVVLVGGLVFFLRRKKMDRVYIKA